MTVTVRVPAKINLVLSVGPVQPDGFHPVATVYHAVSLYDEITASPGDDVTVTTTGPFGGHVPSGRTNLATRAALALAEHAGVRAEVRLRIRKTIPVAGGMAGGSANAAGALLACDALWGLGLSGTELSAVAATVGSDVPFSLRGGTAIGTGRGERLTPIEVGGTLHWAVAIADGGLSTPRVYRRLDALRADRAVEPPRVGTEIEDALRAADAITVGRVLRNDLEEAALDLRSSLGVTLRAGRRLDALGAIVSGSGPTCVFLAADQAHAEAMAAGLRESGTCRAAHAVTGPAATER